MIVKNTKKPTNKIVEHKTLVGEASKKTKLKSSKVGRPKTGKNLINIRLVTMIDKDIENDVLSLMESLGFDTKAELIRHLIADKKSQIE